jgi:predicted ATP-binding protein involved in virulence
MENFLSIPEEILLLSIGENGGEVPQDKNFEVVLAASILMDLAMQNRLDSDLEKLIPVDNTPTGDIVLNDAIEMIFADKTKQDPSHWVSQLAIRAEEFSESIVASLVLKKVLKIENQKLLWFFSKRKYPIVHDTEMKEVKLRVRELVFGDDIPDLRDIVIVSLLHYGQMLELVFTEFEISKYRSRIEKIAMMDLIGQAISKSLKEFATSSFTSLAKSILGVKSPEEKLESLVKEMKEKYRINNDKDLPEWLRKGTAQYIKTIAYIEKTGRADIYYSKRKDEYFGRQYFFSHHLFGSGQ